MKLKHYFKKLNCYLFGHRINVYLLMPPGSERTPCVKCGKMFVYPRGFIDEDDEEFCKCDPPYNVIINDKCGKCSKPFKK